MKHRASVYQNDQNLDIYQQHFDDLRFEKQIKEQKFLDHKLSLQDLQTRKLHKYEQKEAKATDFKAYK